MKFLNDFFASVTSELGSSASNRRSNRMANMAIETCCEELGWSIDSRPSETVICLYFADPLIQNRIEMVSAVDNGAFVSFMTASSVKMPADEVPTAILGYMLERNIDPFVSWRVLIDDDREASFMLNYWVPTPGLNTELFKVICQTMTTEAYLFDERMHKAGLLQ